MNLFYAGGKFGFDTATPAEQVEVKKDQNTGTIILSTNATDNTAAYAGLKAAHATGSIELKAISAAFTTSGADIADTSQLKSTSVSGLILNLIGGSNDLSVYAGGTEVFNIAGSDGNLSVPSLQLTGGTGDQGKITWNTDEETIDIILNGAVLQVGQEIHGHVKNMTGSTIDNGTPVMFVGTQGVTGRLLVAPITGTVQASAKFILGLVTYDIANNGEGKVTALGKVRDIDTTGGLSFGGLETWIDEDILWVDTANDGFLTNVEPSTGMGIGIGVVIRAHATLGSIYVRITPLDRHLYAELGAAANFSSLILEGATSGTTTIQASAVAGGVTYTWPASDGGANEGLITNGSGVLSWSAGGIAAAGSLTGTTLAANVVSSSLTGVGALASGSIASGFGTILTANSIQGTSLKASSGDVDITNGDVLIGTSGKGIDFSGIGTPAEILDDYKEGTWTPVFTPSTSGSFTYTSQEGLYTKIGNLVVLTGFIQIATASSPVGNLDITGLPFTSNSTANWKATGNCSNTVNISPQPFSSTLNNSSTTMNIWKQGDNLRYDASTVGAGARLSFEIKYQV